MFRMRIPKVHGETSKEKAIRSIALILVFGAVIWAFMENNKRVVDRLNQESSIYDETKRLDTAEKKFIVSFTRSLKDEFGVTAQVQIFGGDFVVPELDNKTLYIGIAPAINEVQLRFPPMMRQALGPEFIEMIKNDILLPSFKFDDWPGELQVALVTIFERLTQINEGETASE